MLTEEQEKALLEEIDKLRQDKAALISRGCFAGAVAVLAPEKSLRTDERKKSSA